jgi:hypothetical protein
VDNKGPGPKYFSMQKSNSAPAFLISGSPEKQCLRKLSMPYPRTIILTSLAGTAAHNEF